MQNAPEDGITEIRHTADAAILVNAESLEQLFLRSAKGMYALAGIETDQSSQVVRVIALSAIDLESLLVAFLSELLFFIDEEQTAFHDFAFDLTSSSLKCSMTGSLITAIAKPIKAVTFHNLQIRSTANGFEVTLVFDV